MSLLKGFRGLLEGFLIVVSLLLMAALAIIVISAVAFRYSGASFTWYDEVASIVLAWITYYGAALAALRRAHLGFPNLVALLPPVLRLVALLISEGVVFVFFILLAKFGYEAIVLLQGDALVSLPWIKVEVVMSVIPIGAALFILAELTTLPEKVQEAWFGMPPAEIEHLTEASKS